MKKQKAITICEVGKGYIIEGVKVDEYNKKIIVWGITAKGNPFARSKKIPDTAWFNK